MDSIILLATASSISATSPSDGLTREETAPYADRVLEGGSSNWQVYTQALLVRSRIESYRSRTAERGLLQLQALVDQVIAETSSSTPSKPNAESGPRSKGTSTFLPKPKSSESASPAERLKYIYQLSPPLRWELEAELAARWVSLGGLKTALEIYERLNMHAEVALCLAETDQEAEAIRTLRRILFEPASSVRESDESVAHTGVPLASLPADAPRLLCILGDLEDRPEHYEQAWTVSKGRFSRAQRSLGKYFVRRKKFSDAVEAYEKSLEINRLNASTWFALGCAQLELEQWLGAVESFTRTVQLETEDAEAWTNLAAALLRAPVTDVDDVADKAVGEVGQDSIMGSAAEEGEAMEDQERDTDPDTKVNAYRNTRNALGALRRAAQLKRDDARIWDNYLTAAASLPPPWTPWSDIILAQKRVIELRGRTFGEKAVDEKILTVLVGYVTSEFSYPTIEPETEPAAQNRGKDVGTEATMRPGTIPRELIDMMDKFVAPLITSSAELWLLVAKLACWRRRPLAALEANEKAWRAVTSQPGVYERDEKDWNRVVRATERLVTAYELLGTQERERTGGRVVEGDWRFKARTAGRSVLGKGKSMWADTVGFRQLQDSINALKA